MRRSLRLFLIVALLGAFVVVATTSAQNDPPLMVTTAADDCVNIPSESLRARIIEANASPDPQTIEFSDTFPMVINLQCALPDITGTLTIDGPGANQLTVRRDPDITERFRIFTLAEGSDFTLDGVTIANGYASGSPGFANDGGGIGADGAALGSSNSVNLTITNSVVTGNVADADGGGVYCGGCDLAMTGSTVSNNRAGEFFISGGGGGISAKRGSGIRISDSVVSGNRANTGGGIEIASPSSAQVVEITDTTIEENTAFGTTSSGRGGGGVHIWGGGSGGIELTGGTIVGNDSATIAGGLLLGITPVTLTGIVIEDNTAVGSGGGIFTHFATLTINSSHIGGELDTDEETVINQNVAGEHGGGVYVESGTVTIGEGSSVSFNTADSQGGGIYNLEGTVTVTGGSTIANNEADSAGGGISNAEDGTLVVDGESVISDNTSPNGGGVRNFGEATITGASLIDSNTTPGNAVGRGGGIYNTGTLLVEGGVTVRDNYANTNGGGIRSDGEMTIDEATILENSANVAGGGLAVLNGEVSITRTTIRGNGTTNPSGTGGGIYVEGTGTIVTIADSDISGTVDASDPGNVVIEEPNRSVRGAGIFIHSGMVTVGDGSTVSGNESSQAGGGIMVASSGTLTIQGGSSVSHNVSTDSEGGGIQNFGSVTVTGGSSVSGNVAFDGGGILAPSGSRTVVEEGSRIEGNQARWGGGGIYSRGDLSITDSTITGNWTGSQNIGGGVLVVDNTTIIDRSTISDNTTGEGGGLYIEGSSAHVTITNSTISGNTGASVSGSGGVTVRPGATVDVISSTVSANVGGFRVLGTVTMTGSVLAGNSGDNFVGSGLVDGGNNFVGGNPQLELLGDNGGLTQTMFPQADSPLIDAGGNTCPDVDQRGYDRPSPEDGTCDIGAVEVQQPVLTVPDDIEMLATSPDGTPVEFTATAEDWDDTPLDVTCNPASGSLFGVGDTEVVCTTVGADELDVSDSFTVTILLPEEPTISVPQNISVLATSAAGATVEFGTSATDAHGTPLDVECNRVSGQTFPIGTTTVTCSAEDGYGQTVEDSFTITVNIPAGPTIDLPDGVVVETLDPDGAIVEWEVSASDFYDNSLTVTCNRESGAHYAVGTYRVTCSAIDMFRQEVSGSFTIEVVYVGEMIPPRISPVVNTRIPAAGPDGTVVVYNLSVWSPIDPNPLVVCTPPSGSLFPIGTTTVTCTATDRFGNTSSVTFTITIFVPQEQEPGPSPGLTLPDDMTVNATSPSGALVGYAVGASAGARVICSPAPGTTLPIGTTTVTCTATGGDGQQTSGSFEVRVRGAMEQLRILIADVAADDEDAAVPLILAAIGLNRGFDELSCRQLDVFIAGAGETVWADDARRIRNVIGC